MAVTNKGIEIFGDLLRGDSTDKPVYLSFSGTDATVFDEGLTTLGSEFIRKPVSWAKSGIQSQFTVELSSTESNGSYIKSTGLHTGSGLESADTFSYNESFIGSKTSSINIQVEGETLIRRFA
jgi:hypothetical protein